MKKIGVILSGCGVYDGSEIHNSRSIFNFKNSYFLTDIHTVLTSEKIKKYNMMVK